MRLDAVDRVLAARPVQRRRVLEVGCGRGDLGSRLAVIFDCYLGLEPDSQSCARAQANVAGLHNAQVECMQLEQLASGTLFDAVCAFEVLEHMEDDRALLAAMVDHTERGGIVVATVPADPHRFGPYDNYVGHFRRYEPERLMWIFCDAGLRDVLVFRFGFPLSYAVEYACQTLARCRMRGGGAPRAMAERTAASGRFISLPNSAVRLATSMCAPLLPLQRRFNGRGPQLIACGRRC
jgi:SAM-dependent methyltransferase